MVRSRRRQGRPMCTPRRTRYIISRREVKERRQRKSAQFSLHRGTLKDENSFQSVGLETFQEGNIVEVQVSFIAIPLREGKWRINTTMRSITLFDGNFTHVGEDVNVQNPDANFPHVMVPLECVCEGPDQKPSSRQEGEDDSKEEGGIC